MRFEHRQHDKTTVIFESVDWTSGMAKKVIAYFKSLPTGEKARYSPTTKEWSISNTKVEGMFDIIHREEDK